MYRHSAISIKETDDKQFISSDEKNMIRTLESNLGELEIDVNSKFDVVNGHIDQLRNELDTSLIDIEGSFTTCNETVDGYLSNLEILGNTVQDSEDLSNIKSVGVTQQDGSYKITLVTCGKNLFDGEFENGLINNTGEHLETLNAVRSKNYIKVKPSIRYTVNTPDSYVNYVYIHEFDSNFKICCDEKVLTSSTSMTFTTNENTRYIKFNSYNAGEKVDINIMVGTCLEEGLISTNREPYQSSKCVIKLPVQLEKIGNVSDRLYFNTEEDAWCVEKNIETITLNGTEDGWEKNVSLSTDEFAFMHLVGQNIRPSDSMLDFISDKFIIADYNKYTNECISKYANGKEIVIKINTSKLTTIDPSGIKEWLEKNNVNVKYKLPTPKKIVLPLDIQIQLNSFFGTTHIFMESGEVEGTIKAKIPKSLGSTVQSLVNETNDISKRVKQIEGLKESQNMNYTSDRGFIHCQDSKNGVIDNIKLSGKTLVNLFDLNDIFITGQTNIVDNRIELTTTTNRYSNFMLRINNKAKANTIYTVIANISINTLDESSHIFLSSNNETADANYDKSIFNTTIKIPGGSTGLHVYKLVSKPEITDEGRFLRTYFDNSTLEEGRRVVLDIMLLEGDYTQNTPSYFEGLKSVGDGVDNIEVSSRKEDGNLFNGDLKVAHIEGNTLMFKTNYPGTLSGIIRVIKKGKYVLSAKNTNRDLVGFFKSYPKSGDVPASSGDGSVITDGPGYIVYYMSNQTDTAYPTDISCIYENQNVEFTHCISHKKQLQYYNSLGELTPITQLRGLPNGVKDTVEKHEDGKWYYHKRCEEVVLNGRENWELNDYLDEKLLRFDLFVNTMKQSGVANVISDRFKFHLQGNVGEKITQNTRRHIVIFINKTRLTTYDAEGFKQWLQNNPTTVIYELENEEAYECAPLHLDSYDSETAVICDSGAIQPTLEFSISSHINNLVLANKERIKLLEKELYESQEVQNMVIMENDLNLINMELSLMSVIPAEALEKFKNKAVSRSATYYKFIEGLIERNVYTKEYMEEVLSLYLQTNRIDEDEYDALCNLLHPQTDEPIVMPEI